MGTPVREPVTYRPLAFALPQSTKTQLSIDDKGPEDSVLEIAGQIRKSPRLNSA